MRNKLIIIFIVVFLLLVDACSNAKMPRIVTSIKEMNRSLELSAPLPYNTFKIDDDVGLVLINHSNTPIILPQDYGVHIYQYSNNNWIPIQNLMEYPLGEKIVYPREGKPFREVVLVVYPNILSDQRVKIRVVVIGNYYYEPKGTKGGSVGAYVDVILKPK